MWNCNELVDFIYSILGDSAEGRKTLRHFWILLFVKFVPKCRLKLREKFYKHDPEISETWWKTALWWDKLKYEILSPS